MENRFMATTPQRV